MINNLEFCVFLFLLVLIGLVAVFERWPREKETDKCEELPPALPVKIEPGHVHTAAETIVKKCVVDCDRCDLSRRVHIITPEGSGMIECPLCNGTKKRKVTVKFCALCGKMLEACTCDGA